MGGQARQLLGHIDALGEQAHFEADAVVVEGGGGIAQAGGELLLVFGHQRRHAGLHLGHQGAHVGDAAADHLGELLALAAAGGDELVEGRRDEPDDLGLQRVEGRAIVGEHTGPAQHLGHAEGRGLGQLGLDGELGIFQLAKQHGVNRKLARCAILRLEIETAFDLAAAQLAGDRFPQDGFGLAQIVVDAEGEIEVAGIDAAQFEVQGDAAQVAGLDGVARHAENHVFFPVWSGDPQVNYRPRTPPKDEV